MPGPIKNFKKGIAISEKFHNLVPGASHTYSKGEDQFPWNSPHIMSHALGSKCWDVDGNEFIDWAMGNRVFLLGHGNEVVNNAVKAQIDKGLNFTRPGILEYELAEYLIDLWPSAEMVKFGKNGSDTTTSAIKLARAYTGRDYVGICKQHPFFSVADWFIGTTAANNGVLKSETQYSLNFNYNDIESVKKMFAEHPGQIACLILEPVKNDKPCTEADEKCSDQCTNGICATGKKTFLHQLREICDKEGTVLIFDEMISGIRFDIRGAHHLYGVYPDLSTWGKCIANGYSCSVLAGKKEILELGGIKHDKKRTFLLSQTHGSETTGLAATLATLQECQKLNVTNHIWKMGKKLKDGFNELAKQEGVDNLVRIFGFDCNPQILCTHQDGSYWPELQTSFHEEVISWGVLIPWITITAAHTDQDLIKTMDALRHGMKKVRNVVDSNTVNESFFGEAVKPVFREYN